MKVSVKRFILAGIIGTIVVLAVTIAIYATFFHDFLGQYSDISKETVELISRQPVNVGTMLFANLAHGFLITTVIWWGKFF